MGRRNALSAGGGGVRFRHVSVLHVCVPSMFGDAEVDGGPGSRMRMGPGLSRRSCANVLFDLDVGLSLWGSVSLRMLREG